VLADFGRHIDVAPARQREKPLDRILRFDALVAVLKTE
jgi:hypothetical protein